MTSQRTTGSRTIRSNFLQGLDCDYIVYMSNFIFNDVITVCSKFKLYEGFFDRLESYLLEAVAAERKYYELQGPGRVAESG